MLYMISSLAEISYRCRLMIGTLEFLNIKQIVRNMLTFFISC